MRRWRRIRPWLAAALLACAALWLLDRLFPPPIPQPGAGGATIVLARDGSPLRAYPDAEGVWRYPVQLADVSPHYLDALLGYEDRWFFQHRGINPLALLRAALQAAHSGQIVSGGSTLTMQVARILEPHPRTLTGKARQMLRALQLEWRLDKDEILSLYLDHAPFGGTIAGVEAASWAYLGKPAARLSRAEAALLAVLPQAPSRLRPDRHPERARAARDKVLRRMASLGVWSDAEVAEALQEPVVARSLQPPQRAPLAAERLRREHPGARRIASTLDAALQARIEERVADWTRRLPPGTSAGVLVADTRTLEVLAYVGSARFADAGSHGHIDMIRARRSPGSTLKPFIVGLALDAGLVHSESLLVDAPQSFDGYRPGNFDQRFRGPVSVSAALQASLNVPMVALLDALGPESFATRLAHAGLPLRLPRGARPHLAMALGASEARLDDLVGAYAALHRDGVAARPRLHPDAPLRERRLLSPGAAWIVARMLEDAPQEGEAGGRFDGSGRVRAAWKTGTSYGFRDAWAIGGTRRYTVGVWVGRPDGTPLPGQYGAITALPLLLETIDSLPRTPGDADPLPRPGTVEQADACWPLGLAAADTPQALCQQRLRAWRLDGVMPPTLAERDARLWSSGRERFQVDVETGLRLSADCTQPHPAREAEIARWPALLSPWLPAAWRQASQLPPLAPDCAPDGREGVQALRIEGIIDRSSLAPPPGSQRGLRLPVRALGTRQPVHWLLDGRPIARTLGSGGFEYDYARAGRGEHTLTALADSGAWAQLRFRVTGVVEPSAQVLEHVVGR